MPEDLETAATSGPVARTRAGRVRGFARDGVEAFLGLPYAAPPVGKLRWRPPQTARRWRGVREALAFGPRAAAAASPNGPRGISGNESSMPQIPSSRYDNLAIVQDCL